MIDIFNHFVPKRALERVKELVPEHPAMKAFPEVPTLWDVDERLRMMDEFDGLQQVLSLANPPIEQLGGPELTPFLLDYPPVLLCMTKTIAMRLRNANRWRS